MRPPAPSEPPRAHARPADPSSPTPPALTPAPSPTRRTRVRRLPRPSSLGLGPIVVAVAVQSLGNLLFHMVAGRGLAPADYGALGTVLAATAALAVPLGAAQAAASSLVARHGAGAATVRGLLVGSARAALLGSVLALPLVPVLAGFWHLTGPLDGRLDAGLVLPYAATSLVLATARGALLGVGDVRAVAHGYLASTAVRLALGVVLTPLLGVTGALLATLAGEVAAGVLAVLALRSHAVPGVDRARMGLRGALLPTFTVTGLFLLSTVDLLLARHYLGGADSGAYVAAATIGKTVLALPAALLAVCFPRLTTAWRDPGRRAGELRRSALVVCGSAAGAAGVVLLAPGLTLTVLFGDAYDGREGLVRALVALAALTSVASLLTWAALARGAATLALCWVGAALEVVLVLLRHDSAREVVEASAVAVAATVVLLLALELPAWRHRTGRRRGRATKVVTDAEPALRRP